MMELGFLYLLPFVLACLLLEIASGCIKQWLRRWQAYRRLHCIPSHTWGKRFGPFKPTENSYWYWGWKCAHCVATKTERMQDSDAGAHEYFRKHGVSVSGDGWAVIQAAIDKHHEAQHEAKAREAVESIAKLLVGSPAEWEEDNYHLRHNAAGISLWTANKDYGLKIEKPVKMELPEAIRDRLYKDITMWRSRKPALKVAS